ncbi:MAG: sensor histidine kinase [Desulfobaccales bacterium]
MSLKFLERLRRTIGFRLTLWYSAIFILSSLTLFILAYLLLSSSLEKKDREMILAKVKEYKALYLTGGISAISQEITLEKNAGKPNAFFIRVGSPANGTLLLNIPDQWAHFDLKTLEPETVKEHAWSRLRAKDDENVMEIAAIRLPDRGILQVGKSTESREELLETFRGVFAGVTLVVILIGVIGGQFLAFRALRPIRNLIQTVRAITDTGKIEARMPVAPSNDELEDLARLFNHMLEKIEALISGMKETLDNAAHDLRTPMTRMRGIAELALQAEDNPETCREALADCLEESERVLRMMDTLMDISEAETGTMTLKPEPLNLAELLDGVIELYRYVAEDKQIALSSVYSSELYLTADRDRLRQALANLLDNAVKYTLEGGRVNIEAFDRPGQVVIVIQDNGPGIPPEEISRIWDRLYRGDKSRSQRGLGLGLSLVKAIIAAHHGHVEVSSQPGDGSRFTIYLPKQL